MTKAAPNPSLLDITPYVPGGSQIEGVERVIKLASNEAALGPSSLAVDAIRELAEDVHLYPDSELSELRGAIGSLYDMAPDQLIFGPGSEYLLDLLVRCYASSGHEVLFPQLSFPLYRIITLAAGATPVEAAAPDFTADVDALLAAVTPRTKIVIIANPNNPTGTWIDNQSLARLRRELPDHILLIVDSAYAEYPEDSAYSDGRDLVDAYPENTVMTRTFSKMYALASARVGWAYGGRGVIETLSRVRLTFCVSRMAEAAACAALSDQDHVAAERSHCDHWRPVFMTQLRQFGFRPVDGAGNFVFVPVPQAKGGWKLLDGYLRSRGIIVRPIPPASALRISIGSTEDNRAFLTAMIAYQERLDEMLQRSQRGPAAQ